MKKQVIPKKSSMDKCTLRKRNQKQYVKRYVHIK